MKQSTMACYLQLVGLAKSGAQVGAYATAMLQEVVVVVLLLLLLCFWPCLCACKCSLCTCNC
jgi:hypothetical protein